MRIPVSGMPWRILGLFLSGAAATEASVAKRILRARTTAGRLGEPDECAGAVVFLASDVASFVTGVSSPVDGGYSVF